MPDCWLSAPQICSWIWHCFKQGKDIIWSVPRWSMVAQYWATRRQIGFLNIYLALFLNQFPHSWVTITAVAPLAWRHHSITSKMILLAPVGPTVGPTAHKINPPRVLILSFMYHLYLLLFFREKNLSIWSLEAIFLELHLCQSADCGDVSCLGMSDLNFGRRVTVTVHDVRQHNKSLMVVRNNHDI